MESWDALQWDSEQTGSICAQFRTSDRDQKVPKAHTATAQLVSIDIPVFIPYIHQKTLQLHPKMFSSRCCLWIFPQEVITHPPRLQKLFKMVSAFRSLDVFCSQSKVPLLVNETS